VVHYKPPNGVEICDEALVIPGEDPDAHTGTDKPLRILSDFCIFDPRHNNEVVILSSMEEADGADRQFEGAGSAIPLLENEEDEGQEDDIIDNQAVYVALESIWHFSVNYSVDNE
jgi:DNA (cytosine-5)-methyltransferase 1